MSKCCKAAGLVRVFGPELAEVPLLATRPELQGNGLAPLLLHSLETALLDAGVTTIIMPSLPLPHAPLPDQAVSSGETLCPHQVRRMREWSCVVWQFDHMQAAQMCHHSMQAVWQGLQSF